MGTGPLDSVSLIPVIQGRSPRTQDSWVALWALVKWLLNASTPTETQHRLLWRFSSVGLQLPWDSSFLWTMVRGTFSS